MDNAEVLVKFKGDDSDVKEKANGLGSTLSKAAKVGGASLAAIGTAATATTKALVSGANATAQYGDAIDKNSQKVGLSTKAYQEWDYAMQISGTSMENCAVGLKTLTNKVDDLKNGSSSATETFDKLGISLADVEGKSREEVFSQVVSGLQNITDEAEKAAIANDLFGRSGQELLPMFNLTNEETQKLIEEANEYGMVMGSDAVDASAAFQDSLTKMQGTIAGVKNGILGGLLPGFTDVTDGLAMLVNGADGAEDKIAQGVENVMNNITQALPKIIDVITRLIPKLTPVIVSIITKIADVLMKNLPTILKVGVNILLQLIKGITSMIPELIPCIVECIMAIVQGLLENMDLIIEGGIQLVLGIIDGIISALPVLMENAPQIIVSVVTALIKALPQVLSFGVRLVGTLVTGIASVVSKIPETLIKAFSEAWKGIQEVFSTVADFFATIFGNAWTAVKNVFSIGGKIFDGIKDGIVNGFKIIVNGIITGINKVVALPFNAINGILETLHDISILGVKPFGWLGTISVPQIPKLNVGTNYVPKDEMPAILHKGEAVVPKKFNPYANGINPQTIGSMTNPTINTVVNVYNNMEIDPLGQVVNNIKTFSGGSKNDYNYGYGGI